MTATTHTLPELHLADWRATKDTLHLFCQVVGKVRLKATQRRNHWWNVPLYVDVRGLTTRRMHHAGQTFQIDLDFVDHDAVVRVADGRTASFPLRDGLTVADFDRELHALLAGLGIDVEILEVPFGVPMTTPFPDDREHGSWDAEYVERFWRVLDFTDQVLEEFTGWFTGKASPVHLYWHSFDLAVSRFSGRAAPPMDADAVTREAYSREVMGFGFWAGDDRVPDATYYAYIAPEPEGLREAPLVGGEWIESNGGSLAVLPYEQVRRADDPRRALLVFLQSAYEAGARAAGWDLSLLTSNWCPTAEQLEQLRRAASADFGRVAS